MRFASFLRAYALIAVVAIALSACSSGSLPNAPTTPSAQGVHVAGASTRMTLVPMKSQCNKKMLQLCIEQGSSGTLRFKVTCPRSCGTVTWSASFTVSGLKGSFKPNKALKNSTVEKVTAASFVLPGTYNQFIRATSSVAGSVLQHFYPVTVQP